jgi:hypothetical protein
VGRARNSVAETDKQTINDKLKIKGNLTGDLSNDRRHRCRDDDVDGKHADAATIRKSW